MTRRPARRRRSRKAPGAKRSAPPRPRRGRTSATGPFASCAAAEASAPRAKCRVRTPPTAASAKTARTPVSPARRTASAVAAAPSRRARGDAARKAAPRSAALSPARRRPATKVRRTDAPCASADQRRKAVSVGPRTLAERAMSQGRRGGLCGRSSPANVGTRNSPDESISTAERANRDSSRSQSVVRGARRRSAVTATAARATAARYARRFGTGRGAFIGRRPSLAKPGSP